MQSLTAWHALTELAHARPGESVLVHSALGGVGLAALRICQALGLTAVGTVGDYPSSSSSSSSNTSHTSRTSSKVNTPEALASHALPAVMVTRRRGARRAALSRAFREAAPASPDLMTQVNEPAMCHLHARQIPRGVGAEALAGFGVVGAAGL